MRKIAVDTNILVRLLARDDTHQWQLALKLLAENVLVVGSTVLLETEWVLKSQFGYSRQTVATLLGGLAELENLQFQEPDRVLVSLRAFHAGMDFADAMHVAGAADIETFVTFDRDLARRARQNIHHVSVELAS
jgi:predicted nucleic-acid-binding protein